MYVLVYCMIRILWSEMRSICSIYLTICIHKFSVSQKDRLEKYALQHILKHRHRTCPLLRFSNLHLWTTNIINISYKLVRSDVCLCHKCIYLWCSSRQFPTLIQPSIHYLSPVILCRLRGIWCLSQLTLGDVHPGVRHRADQPWSTHSN